MKKSLVLCSLAIVCFLIATTACRKKVVPPTAVKYDTTCRVSVIGNRSLTDSSTYFITYDAQGRIDKIVLTGVNAGTETYTYSGNYRITIATDSIGGFREKDSATFNSDGWLTFYSILRHDSTHEAITCIYDENKQFKYLIDDHVDHIDTTLFTFENGDLMSSQGTDVARNGTYTYYPDILAGDGDGNQMQQFLQFRAYCFKSKHLIKNLSVLGGIDVTVSYMLDSKGKIIHEDGVNPLSPKPFISSSFDYLCK